MLGLIGGIGPLGGVDLAFKLCQETDAACDQDHPDMVLLSLPASVPDRSEYLLRRARANPGEAIGRLARVLADLGCSFIAVSCNTAHAEPIWQPIVQALAQHPGQPRLLHIVEEVGDYLASSLPGLKRVGVLSSTGTWSSGIYPEVLARRGVEVISPDAENQERLVHRAIYDPEFGLKGRANKREAAASLLLRAVDLLQERGAEAIILACTELPVGLPQAEVRGLPLIDPNRILALALLRAYREALATRP